MKWKTIFISTERERKSEKKQLGSVDVNPFIVYRARISCMAYRIAYVIRDFMWTRYTLALSVYWDRQTPEPNARHTHTQKNVLWIASIDVWHGIFHYFPCFKQIASSYHRQIVAGNRENRKIDIFILLESEKRDETRDTKQEEWMNEKSNCFSGINWSAFAIFQWIVVFVLGILHFWVIIWNCRNSDEKQMPF